MVAASMCCNCMSITDSARNPSADCYMIKKAERRIWNPNSEFALLKSNLSFSQNRKCLHTENAVIASTTAPII